MCKNFISKSLIIFFRGISAFDKCYLTTVYAGNTMLVHHLSKKISTIAQAMVLSLHIEGCHSLYRCAKKVQ